MLQAIWQGKAGRIEQDGSSVRWRELFRRSEDLLSATFFGRFPYLSDAALSAVLECLIGSPAGSLSPFEKLELWPRLTRLEERSYVEPDVLLRFRDELVMIEVKPPFGGGQYREQWLAQTRALAVEDEYANYQRIYYVALGNAQLQPLSCAELPDARFVGMTLREWGQLRLALLETTTFETCRQDRAILDDWLCAFELFGMAPYIPSWTPLFSYAGSLHCDLSHIASIHLAKTAPVLPTWSSLLDYACQLSLEPLQLNVLHSDYPL